MPDITMCQGGKCTIKEECYRYKAKPSEYRQSYFAEPPFKKKMDGTSCEYFDLIRSMEVKW